jgi:16S rRNA (cytosine1402-N4)-methyltransferase
MKSPDLDQRAPHQPVLYQEILDYLKPASPGKFVDGTLGAGGHAAGILDACAPKGSLLGLDVDDQALAIARERTAQFGARIIIQKASYASLNVRIRELGWECVNGIVLDLGLSSMQLDTAERGFSFQKDASLDMRFDQAQALDAARLVNESSQQELTAILRNFGEEPHANRIAAAILKARPLRTTKELAALVLQAYRGERGKVHPATRTFQALRMAVNRELETLELGLWHAITSLCSSGKLAVISFHSLEDRLVKQTFQRESRDCICPPEQIICTCGHQAVIKVITKRAIQPSKEEIAQNPRARSAKLRVVEKL